MIKSPIEFFSEKYRGINKNEKIAFLSALICGFFCHLFMITNKIPNHDDLRSYINLGGGLRNGRPFSMYAQYLSGTLSSPWIIGLLTIIYLAFVALVLNKIFKIKSQISSFLLGLTVVTFPAIASVMGHMYGADALTLPILLATIAVYLLQKGKSNNKICISFSSATILLAISLCFYQVSFGFAAALVIMILFFKEITEEKYLNDKEWYQNFFSDVAIYLSFLIISLLIYIVVIKLMTMVTGISLTDRKGIGSMGVDMLLQVPNRVIEPYKQFCWYVFLRNSQTTFGTVAKLASIVCTIYSLYISIVLAVKNKVFNNFLRAIMFFLLLLALPFAVEFMYVLMDSPRDVNYHMSQAMILWFVFLVIIVDKALIYSKQEIPKKNKSQINFYLWIALICISVIQWDNWLYTGNAYHAAYLSYEQTYAYFLKMSQRIEETEGFTYYMPIAISGNFDYNDKPETLGSLKTFSKSSNDGKVGHPVTSLPGEYTLITTYAYPYFFEFYLGEKYNFCSKQEIQEINRLEEVENMPVYPREGSIKIIDGILVLKQ